MISVPEYSKSFLISRWPGLCPEEGDQPAALEGVPGLSWSRWAGLMLGGGEGGHPRPQQQTRAPWTGHFVPAPEADRAGQTWPRALPLRCSEGHVSPPRAPGKPPKFALALQEALSCDPQTRPRFPGNGYWRVPAPQPRPLCLSDQETLLPLLAAPWEAQGPGGGPRSPSPPTSAIFHSRWPPGWVEGSPEPEPAVWGQAPCPC